MRCFKAYDIRGIIDEDLTDQVVRDIGRAFCEVLNIKSLVIGGDIRETSAHFKDMFSEGAIKAGSKVLDLGMTGTEEIYFATSHLGVDGGVEITASHNPINYNGIKMVKHGSVPVSPDELQQIRQLVESGVYREPGQMGQISAADCREAYIEHLLSYIQVEQIRPMKVVVDPGNGAAGPVVAALTQALPMIEFVKINFQPDGSFPNGIPNPLLPEMRALTRQAVLDHGADFGVAWDGDFDRCFLFDETGAFIEGYYIVGLLAEAFLRKCPGEKIIHDPRLTWNTIEEVRAHGGIPVLSQTGHAYIKQKMREEDAVYGGEMSAHHYFRDFNYCDSGMIPWLLALELLSVSGRKLSELVAARRTAYPVSGEINFKVNDAAAVMAGLRAKYEPTADLVMAVDGLTLEFEQWRFNVRSSNTEPLLRLNVEARGNRELMAAKTQEISAYIKENAS